MGRRIRTAVERDGNRLQSSRHASIESREVVSRVMNDDNRDYRPSEAAEKLGIPPSTLRTYAFQFRAILSPEAGAEPPSAGRGFRHRRYTEADMIVLGRAMLLLGDGLSYRAVLARLGRVSPGAAAKAPDRRSQVRRPRPGMGPAKEPGHSQSPTSGEVAPVSGDVPNPTSGGISREHRVQPPAPRSSEVDESALEDLKVRLSRLEVVVTEQTSSIDRVERAVSATFRALQELRNWFAPPEPSPTPIQQPDRRGWLARLLGRDRSGRR